jgi:regulatory protein
MPETAADRRARQQERRERRAAVTDPDVVLAAGAALLGMRARTTHDLRARLAAMGYQPELVEETLQRLETLGYLDDAGFARAWVASRDRGRPRGAAALRRELTSKGLDRDLVDATLFERDQDAASSSEDDGPPGPDAHPGTADLAAATRLLERRRAALEREPDLRKRRQRAYALLARNGFDPGICMEATRASLSRDPVDEDEAGQV